MVGFSSNKPGKAAFESLTRVAIVGWKRRRTSQAAQTVCGPCAIIKPAPRDSSSGADVRQILRVVRYDGVEKGKVRKA